MANKRKIFIIEGGNCTGKNHILNLINDFLPDATVIESHGFYFKISQRGADKKYYINRLFNLIDYIKEHDKEDIVLVRFHLSEEVFRNYYLSDKEWYEKIDQELKKLKTKLILLDVSNKHTLRNRFNKRKLRLVDEKDISPHIKTYANLVLIKNLYLSYYNKSKLEKYILDTSKDIQKELKEIIKT